MPSVEPPDPVPALGEPAYANPHFQSQGRDAKAAKEPVGSSDLLLPLMKAGVLVPQETWGERHGLAYADDPK